MTSLTKLIVVSLLVGIGVRGTASYGASGAEWLTDIDAAIKVASETGRPILVDFSGSDWCGWCIKLDKEVFSKKEFTDYAKENLVLLLVDFPKRKKLSASAKKKNDELAEKYGVRGFPTVLLLDEKGEVLGRSGYRRGGPAKYIEHIKTLKTSG